MGRGLLEDGEVGISASNLNFKGRLASPEVVAASSLNGVLSGPGIYEVPENYSGVEYGYSTGAPATAESKLSNAFEQLESLIDRVEASVRTGSDAAQVSTKILPGFPTKISGEIVFRDADNLDTDNIYASKLHIRMISSMRLQGLPHRQAVLGYSQHRGESKALSKRCRRAVFDGQGGS